MKTDLEHKDIEAIAQRVAELILPRANGRPPASKEDEVYDVKALATYLKVKPRWVYDRVKENAIPFIRVGRYIRFSKASINEWLENQTVRPIP